MRHLVLALVLLAPATAHAAGERAGAKSVLAAQVKALESMSEGLADTFTADALVIVPDNIDMGETLDEKLGWAFVSGHEELVRVKVKNLKVGALDGAAWLTADLVCYWVGHGEDNEEGTGGETVDFLPVTLRLTELVVRDGKTWKARAAHFSSAMSDKDVQTGRGDDLVAVPGAAEDAEHAALLESPAALAVSTDKATALLGSAGEKAFGAARVKKRLKKWAKLKFTVVGGLAWQTTDAWSFAAANVDLQSGDRTLHYRVLAIFDAEQRLVSLHYSAAHS